MAAAPVDGIAVGGTLGRDKEEMYGVLEMTLPLLPGDAPRHLLGVGEPDDLVEGVRRGVDLFDCAVPTRLARHGMALAPLPGERHRLDVRHPSVADEAGPLVEGCACPACRKHSRAYLHYLSRSEELTGVRLLTLHNLTYVERLVAGAREAISARRFERYAEAGWGEGRRGRRRADPRRRRADPPGGRGTPRAGDQSGAVCSSMNCRRLSICSSIVSSTTRSISVSPP